MFFLFWYCLCDGFSNSIFRNSVIVAASISIKNLWFQRYQKPIKFNHIKLAEWNWLVNSDFSNKNYQSERLPFEFSFNWNCNQSVLRRESNLKIPAWKKCVHQSRMTWSPAKNQIEIKWRLKLIPFLSLATSYTLTWIRTKNGTK